MKTKSVQLPGVSQEEEDKLFQENLDKKRVELDEREAELRKKTLGEIESSKEKTPRRAVSRVRVEREGRRSGLRF